MDPLGARSDFHPIRREFRGKRVGHEGIVRSVMKAQSLPTISGHNYDRSFSGSDVHAEGDFFSAAVGMKDEVIHRAAFDEDVRIVGREPMQIVDGAVAGEHVVVLALHCEGSPADVCLLGRDSDDAEIARLFWQRREF